MTCHGSAPLGVCIWGHPKKVLQILIWVMNNSNISVSNTFQSKQGTEAAQRPLDVSTTFELSAPKKDIFIFDTLLRYIQD